MKSNIKIKYWLPVFTLLLILSACTDFLNVPPRDAYGDKAFYVTPETGEMAVNAIYNVLLDFPTDEMTDDGSVLEEQKNLFDYFRTETYQDCYIGINDANVALKYLPNIDFGDNTADQARLIAEARTLRAYYYFVLSSYLGGVPLIDHELTYEEYSTVERTDLSEVRDFILEELIASIPDLPARGDAVNGRVTKDVARYIVSQIYMYEKNWTEAKNYLEAIMNTGDYSLVPEYKNVCSYDTKLAVCDAFEYTSESIFEASLVEGLDGYGEDNSDRQTFLNCSGDDWRDSEQSLHYQYFDYTFLIEEQTISRTVSQDSTWLNIVDGHYVTTPAGQTAEIRVNYEDPRREWTMLIYGDEVICPINPNYYLTYDYTCYGSGQTNCLRRKYWPTSDVTYAGSRGMNFLIIRYANVLLDYAEVQYRLGNDGVAYEYMNKVRERAWVGHPRTEWERKENEVLFPDGNWNQTVAPILLGKGYDKTLVDLIHEYLLEFGGEGKILRFMMRWENRVDMAEAFAYKTSDIYPERTWIGYPIEEIEKNPNIKQNPGFD